MIAEPDWKAELVAFFDTRGDAVSQVPTIEELCYVAGRDPRLWRNEALLTDLKLNIVTKMSAGPMSQVLEVGCASGFLARLVAPEVANYVGIDLAPGAIAVARRLSLPNANFEVADGERLPFSNASFDAAFCYDVYTNFPTFEYGVPLIVEMLRVVKPGGRVLIGSLPDSAMSSDLPRRVQEICADLDQRNGPRPNCFEQVGGADCTSERRVFAEPVVKPNITTYDFARDDFANLATKLGVEIRIEEIHGLNPYSGFRFNAIYWSRLT